MQSGSDMGAFVSYAERIDAPKERARGEKFFDHFGQATLFWNSQSDVEKNHLVDALRFELGKLDAAHPRAHARNAGPGRRDARQSGGAGARPGGAGQARGAAQPEHPGGCEPEGLSAPAWQTRRRALRRVEHGEHRQGERPLAEGGDPRRRRRRRRRGGDHEAAPDQSGSG